MPAVAELTVRVEVPEPPRIEDMLSVAVNPTDGVAVRLTVPLNPLRDETVTVEVADSVASMLIGEDAVSVKSRMLNVTVAVWVANPVLVAVSVTV